MRALTWAGVYRITTPPPDPEPRCPPELPPDLEPPPDPARLRDQRGVWVLPPPLLLELPPLVPLPTDGAFGAALGLAPGRAREEVEVQA